MERMYQSVTAWNNVPEWSLARSSAEPQSMYAELAQKCPVARNAAGTMIILTMDDTLYINKHRSVEQASKFLGSNRPAIPLGLDGPEHTKYRRLLDPVFTAKRIAPLADQVRALAHELIDGFIDRHEIDAYQEWCEPLPSRIFLSIMGLPMDDLPGFLNFKELTLGNEQLERDPPEVAAAKRAEAVQWIQDYFNRSLDERERVEIPETTCWAGS